MTDETIENVVDTTETQLQDNIKERKTKRNQVDVAEVLKEIKAGTSLKDLANRFNVSYCAFYNYKELKEALTARKNAKKQALLQQIADLASQGLNNKEIAARIDVSLVTLRKLTGGKIKAKKIKQDDQVQVEIPKEPPKAPPSNEICLEDTSTSMIPAPAKAELDSDKYGSNQ